MTTLLLFIFTMLTQASAENANCPPKITPPDFFYTCKADSDCVVAGDNCRSCENRFILNKKYAKEFDERDQLLRNKFQCTEPCAACDTSQVAVYCVNKRCSPLPPPPPEPKGKKKAANPAAVTPKSPQITR